MPMSTRCVCLLALVALVCVLGAHAEVLTLVSDIHYDPLYGASKGYKCTTSAAAALGQMNCDSPKALMDSLFADMSTRQNAYTLYAGDWQRHGFTASGLTANALWVDEATGLAGITTSGSLDTSGQASVVGCLGNNDVIPDYEFNWNTNNQADLEARVEILLADTVLNSAEAATMKPCGYYSRVVSSTLRVLSLHSLIWANTVKPTVPSSVADPCGQFAFLESELSAAQSAGQKVIIVTHFPTTINFYAVAKKGAFTDAETDMYWKPRFQEKYYELLAKYAGTVTLQLFGHTHMFTPIAHKESTVPAVILPAISPIFGNVPAYLEATFTSDWTVANMQQRYLVNSAWNAGVDIADALDLTGGLGSVDALRDPLTDLLTDNASWDNYLTVHSGGVRVMGTFPNSQCNSFCRAATVCSMTNAYYDDITACVTAAATDNNTTPSSALGAQLGGAFFTVTSAVIFTVALAVVVL